MSRPPFWKRTYLLEPKLQIGVTVYMLMFAVGAMAITYFSVKQTLLAVIEEASEIAPGCHALLQDQQGNVNSVLATIFTINGSVLLIFAFIGGILISHRIVGPIYRFKRIIRDMADGKDPGRIEIRKDDFFYEMIPLLQDLKNTQDKDRASLQQQQQQQQQQKEKAPDSI